MSKQTTPARIIIGADHRGAEAATALKGALGEAGHTVECAQPCDTNNSTDYPEPAWIVGQRVAGGGADFGILICGTAIGMSIAANKINGIRAAVVHDELTAELARAHNNANVLCLSGDLLGQRLIEKIVQIWLRTPFEGGRHERRLGKITMIEQEQDPRV